MPFFNLFKPKTATNSLSLSQTFSFGKATSGVDVTERTALNVSAGAEREIRRERPSWLSRYSKSR
jgi:hypothetical protein